MILKNMTAVQALKSKAMLGGLALLIAGGFLMYKGEYVLGLTAIGNGLGIMGIRDDTARQE